MAKPKRFLSPQQELFLSFYCNPKSATFGNAYQSAIEAKYGKKYAENITGQLPDWLSENLGDLKRLKKAEKVLDETLEMETKSRRIINDEIIETEEVPLLKIKQDTAKFVASGLGKAKYSSRSEHTGAEGKDLPVPIINVISTNNSNTKDTETDKAN